MESRKVTAAVFPTQSCCNKSCSCPKKVSRHRIPAGTPFSGGSLSIQNLLQQIVLQWNHERYRRQSFQPKAAATNRVAAQKKSRVIEFHQAHPFPAAVFPYKSCCKQSSCNGTRKVPPAGFPSKSCCKQSSCYGTRKVPPAVFPSKSCCYKSSCNGTRKVPPAVFPTQSCCNKSCCCPKKVSRHRIPRSTPFSVTVEPREVPAAAYHETFAKTIFVPSKLQCGGCFGRPGKLPRTESHTCHCNPAATSLSATMEPRKVPAEVFPSKSCCNKS
jgi:hypothetical protein